MAASVQRWRKYATGVLLVAWFMTASVIGSRWSDNRIVGTTLFSLGCLLMGVGVIGRVWCLVCIAGFKNEELITDGPYSMSRNPLYFYSLVGTVGAGMGSCTISFPMVAIVGFCLWYPAVIRFEARNLAQRHGEAYEVYRRKTPVLIPSFAGFHENSEHRVRSSSFRRGLFDTIWFFGTFAMMHVFSELHRCDILPVWFRLP